MVTARNKSDIDRKIQDYTNLWFWTLPFDVAFIEAGTSRYPYKLEANIHNAAYRPIVPELNIFYLKPLERIKSEKFTDSRTFLVSG